MSHYAAPLQRLLKKGIDVAYLDKQIIILNKPSGLVTQGTMSSIPEKLAQSITPVFRELTRELALEESLMTVHRLDKQTTGCLVIARSPDIAKATSKRFAERNVTKHYLALVRNDRKQLLRGKYGRITTGWSLSGGRPSVIPLEEADRAEAPLETSWKVIDVSKKYPVALMNFILHTGFKHQLRLHAAHILHSPILGDQAYTPPSLRPLKVELPPDRMFLHASSIGMDRFNSGSNLFHSRGAPYRPQRVRRLRLTITSPIPLDFLSLCARLGMAPKLTRDKYLGEISLDCKDDQLAVPSEVFHAWRQGLSSLGDPGFEAVHPFEIPLLHGSYFVRDRLVGQAPSILAGMDMLPG